MPPDNGPPADAPERHPSPAEWRHEVAAMRERLMRDRKRGFPPGTKVTCPSCNAPRSLESREDLERQLDVGPAVVLIYRNLHGARCRRCGTEVLEPYEEAALEEQAPPWFRGDYEASVSRVTGRNIGTYWPSELVRVMDLHPKDRLSVQVIGPDTMVLRRVRAEGEDTG